MPTPAEPSTSRRERPARRRRLRRAALLAAAGVLLFALGVALGQALEDAPRAGRRTEVRTLRPQTVTPPARTVTVTVTRTS